ncbi:MAG: glycosyltransferase [Pseudomonadota bacterium]
MAALASPMIYIVLGVYDPVLTLLEQQLRSLLQQSHTRFQVLLVEDGPQTPDLEALVSSLRDERLVRCGFPETVGVHANYARGVEEALRRSQQGDDLFAFCDQDDVWHPDKLRRQVAFLSAHPGRGLCHCDARVVGSDGEILAPSLFAFEKRSKRFGVLDILIMNAVTGMTCLSTKTVMCAAQGFPVAHTQEILHDHWLALVAAAEGEVAFLDEPLVDYVQHTGNELGARDQKEARKPGWNLLFGGVDYWTRCRRQYAWRAETFQVLAAGRSLSEADITGWSGGTRLVKHMLSSLSLGQSRQAAQSWRLLAGKLLSRR